mgnify:CR=1 FL=1
MTVRGRVQGVFFRDSVRRLALERGVAGSAENHDDGSVVVVLEGPREGVEGVVAFCSEGPDRAEVSQVEVDEEEPRGVEGFDTA